MLSTSPIAPPTVTLSPAAEAQLVFWAAPDESIHPVATVAAVTDLAANTLQNLRVAGEGPSYLKRGGKIWYKKAAVVSWMRGDHPDRPAQH